MLLVFNFFEFYNQKQYELHVFNGVLVEACLLYNSTTVLFIRKGGRCCCYERHRQVMSKISAPKGTRDILPPETAAWQHAERVFADVCGRFGYQEIRIPTFEQTELFQRGVGDTTDVVQKEMYTFEDKGGRSMTLRPEGTAGVVRSYLENGMASWPSPVRLFYNITAFRYEKMQKGRYREIHQFGCEAFAPLVLL